jgi:hypothetical protein
VRIAEPEDEMPTVQALYDHYRNDPRVEFLIISRLDSPAAVRRYAHRNHFDLPFYTMEDEQIPPWMQLHQFPSSFIYAPDGTLAARPRRPQPTGPRPPWSSSSTG